ncbi:MAG: S41 family peptidase [Actinobacteria bacterium]|nr:S41 family peptidase [Actinomycetota bacterium]
MRPRFQIALIGLATLVALWAVFAGGFVAGQLLPNRGRPAAGVVAGDPPAASAEGTGEATDFKVFWEAWNAIQERFYRGPIDPQRLREGAIKGLAQATGDDYTLYQNAAEARRVRDSLRGSFEGVGIRVQLKENRPFIIEPIHDSPAARAGIEPKSLVLAVDGVSTEGMSMERFGELVRGERGTAVTLRVRREGAPVIREVTVIRDRIVVPSVTWRIVQSVGYMRVSNFNSRTFEEARMALQEFGARKVSGLVLDLRNDLGGYLDTSVQIASLFLPEGALVLTQESRVDGNKRFLAAGGFKDVTTLLVVLVNGNTASASEIVAGALQAHHRAALVGEPTFGKGSMQELHRLSDDSIMRVTSGIWITPAGVSLNGTGLAPDVAVTGEVRELGADDDPVLQEALRILAAGGVRPPTAYDAVPRR